MVSESVREKQRPPFLHDTIEAYCFMGSAASSFCWDYLLCPSPEHTLTLNDPGYLTQAIQDLFLWGEIPISIFKEIVGNLKPSKIQSAWACHLEMSPFLHQPYSYLGWSQHGLGSHCGCHVE